MPCNQLILCCPLLQPSIFPSIWVFSKESVFHIRWPKYWSLSFSISPSNEYSGLISFRIDWLDFLAVQGTLESLLQHYSSKASILQCSTFIMVQLLYPYLKGCYGAKGPEKIEIGHIWHFRCMQISRPVRSPALEGGMWNTLSLRSQMCLSVPCYIVLVGSQALFQYR